MCLSHTETNGKALGDLKNSMKTQKSVYWTGKRTLVLGCFTGAPQTLHPDRSCARQVAIFVVVGRVCVCQAGGHNGSNTTALEHTSSFKHPHYFLPDAFEGILILPPTRHQRQWSTRHFWRILQCCECCNTTCQREPDTKTVDEILSARLPEVCAPMAGNQVWPVSTEMWSSEEPINTVSYL